MAPTVQRRCVGRDEHGPCLPASARCTDAARDLCATRSSQRRQHRHGDQQRGRSHAWSHGEIAGDLLHAPRDPTAPGFMSDLDKSKLNGIAAGATATPLSAQRLRMLRRPAA